MSRKRSILFACLTVIFGIAIGLVLLEAGLGYYARHVQSQQEMAPGFLVYNHQFGWEMARNWSGRHRHIDFDVRYSTNERGLRGPWPEPVPGGLRHALAGDSFTFGLGAHDAETFVQRLNEARGETVYLNAGIAGYSTDQQYLYLKDHLSDWNLDALTLVVYLANDLLDNTLRFPLQAEMGKPLFTLADGELRLTNVPVPLQPKRPEDRTRTLASMVLGEEMARRQEASWRNRWQLPRTLGLAEAASPEDLAGMPERLAQPIDLFIRIVQEIRRLCADNGVELTLALMPGRSYVESPGSLSAAFQESLRQGILARQSDLGVPVFDLATRLRDRAGEHLFHPNEGHLTATGHQVVADLLKEILK